MKPVFETALGIVEISCVVYPNRALPVSENGDEQGRRHLIGCQPRSWSDVIGEKLTLFICIIIKFRNSIDCLKIALTGFELFETQFVHVYKKFYCFSNCIVEPGQ